MLLTITGLLLLALCGLVAARSRLQLAAIAVVLGAKRGQIYFRLPELRAN